MNEIINFNNEKINDITFAFLPNLNETNGKIPQWNIPKKYLIEHIMIK